jgi:hypothetical protein
MWGGGGAYLLPVPVTLGADALVNNAEIALAQRKVLIVLYLTVLKL